MKTKDWNPELYLKFKRERTQPSIDLVSRINLSNPKKIIDIGCGPGNSTQVLVERWFNSKILGVDKSPSMIEKAKNDFPNQEWKVMDASNFELNENYDLVFSSATIQWIPEHDKLLNNLWRLVNEGGGLAVQVPLFHLMPISRLIEEVANEDEWKNKVLDDLELLIFNNSHYYYNVLSKLSSNIELWETDYYHIMNSHKDIIEMIKSTGMKPYLDKLESEKEKNEFEKKVYEKIVEAYPKQDDDKVLFPFKRLFFIAYHCC
jgi:trans-aconitate 2-methyltransferase